MTNTLRITCKSSNYLIHYYIFYKTTNNHPHFMVHKGPLLYVKLIQSFKTTNNIFLIFFLTKYEIQVSLRNIISSIIFNGE